MYKPNVGDLVVINKYSYIESFNSHEAQWTDNVYLGMIISKHCKVFEHTFNVDNSYCVLLPIGLYVTLGTNIIDVNDKELSLKCQARYRLYNH